MKNFLPHNIGKFNAAAALLGRTLGMSKSRGMLMTMIMMMMLLRERLLLLLLRECEAPLLLCNHQFLRRYEDVMALQKRHRLRVKHACHQVLGL